MTMVKVSVPWRYESVWELTMAVIAATGGCCEFAMRDMLDLSKRFSRKPFVTYGFPFLFWELFRSFVALART